MTRSLALTLGLIACGSSPPAPPPPPPEAGVVRDTGTAPEAAVDALNASDSGDAGDAGVGVSAPDDVAIPDAPTKPDGPPVDVVAPRDAPPSDGPTVSLCSRQVVPINGARVTSQRPTLQFARAPGLSRTLFELCREPGCASPVMASTTTDNFFVPTMNLTPGVWFWRLTPRNAEGASCTTPTWQFTVPARSLTPGRSWASTLDVNGDGFGDLAVATVGSAGEVRVFHGAATGLSTAAAVTITGLPVEAGAFRAAPVPTAAGDLNGDGFLDLAIGLAAARDGAGEVRVHFGGPRGVAATPEVTLTSPDGRFGHFGASLAGIGDIEGDGLAELIVGAPRAMAASAADPSGVPGRVYVFHGMPTGLRGIPTTTITGPGGNNGLFGAAVGSAGDVNQDRFPDVIVGAPGVARAYVFTGNALGLSTTATSTFSAPSVTRYGALVGCAGDVDGDNRADVFVAGDESAGRVDVRRAGTAGDFAPAPAQLALGGAAFGRSVAAADVNADGFSDVVVAAPGVGSAASRALVYLGGATGVGLDASFTLRAPGGVGLFAESVASVGDVNRDGASDLVFSAATNLVFVPGTAMGTPAPRAMFSTSARVVALAGSTGGL